ncbi:LysE family transporter [Neorhizobium sp. LjRoot104]|uniref:LysE family transporter n=1 Tax=Neorhizobium sp. LjRoot104 TaxID=3342254 RepID=UPI003ECF1E7C
MLAASPAFQSTLTMRMLPLLSSLILPYALMLITPGPNLLVVLRTALKPSWRRVISVAAGIAFGATSACLLAAFGASTLGKLDNIEWLGTLLLAGILVSSAFRIDTRGR